MFLIKGFWNPTGMKLKKIKKAFQNSVFLVYQLLPWAVAKKQTLIKIFSLTGSYYKLMG